MNSFKNSLMEKTWPGVVVDNNDPKKIGRIKVRVKFVFDKIDADDLPWATPTKSIDGKDFKCPEVGKIVNVNFFAGDIYSPEYISAEHYGYTLQQYLEELSYEDYKDFIALIFDDNSQVFRHPTKGFFIDNKKTNINIDNNGNIYNNLRDNKSKFFIGSDDATQALLLANNFIEWNDTLITAFTNGGFIGNLGIPVMASPELMQVISNYQADRNKFLSKHGFISDNDEIKPQNRNTFFKIGDSWESYEKNNIIKNNIVIDNIKIKEDNYIPEERPITGRAEIIDKDIPTDIQQSTYNETIKTIDVKSIYENGKIPTSELKKSKYLSKSLSGDATFLETNACIALDALMDFYNTQNFTGKQKILFTDGYRSYERQVALYNKLGAGRAAKPGKSNHGWGIAVDFYWGVRTEMYKNDVHIKSAFKHPVYKWLFENGPKYGWFNPLKLRDGSKTDEWWHWEYYGNKNIDLKVVDKYKGEFTSSDINIIKSYSGSYYV